MTQAPPEFHGPDALLDRLANGSRPVVFLVGSALTMPHAAGKPGVADVKAMRALIRDAIGTPKGSGLHARTAAATAIADFDRAMSETPDPGAQYRRAFELLKARGDGARSVNRVIRAAVLQARDPRGAHELDDIAALTRLERFPDAWYLGPAVKALGLILARHQERFGSLVLTTNFDPLIELAVRAAGGEAVAVDLVGNGSLPTTDARATSVAHLHGLWRGDSLNTSAALAVDRAALRRSLARLYDEVTLVVLAYGGWDDVLMRALAELTADFRSTPDVIWCFYGSDTEALARKHAQLLNTLGQLRERTTCYAGINCHEFLPRLRARLDGECEILGRTSVCHKLLDALDSGKAVELIGERFMNRSALLHWMERQARLRGKPVARISAQELGVTPSPGSLVRRVAEALGPAKKVEIDRELTRDRAEPDLVALTRALDCLRDTWILIDDAEALTAPGHQFSLEFFANLRSRVQARELMWVSVSTVPLSVLYNDYFGRGSPFLNDAVEVLAGSLDAHEVEQALAARLGERTSRALAATGTLPGLVQRMCASEWGDVDGALASLRTWAESMFAAWWGRLANDERQLLRQAVEGIAYDRLSSRERSFAKHLSDRGLMAETSWGYELNGELWRAYVSKTG